MQCTLDCPRVHTSYLICMYAIFNLVLLLASRRASFTQVLYCTITQREYIHTYSVRRSVRQRARSGSARATRVQQCGAVPSAGNINITRVEVGNINIMHVEVERGSGSQHARTGEMYCIVSRQKGLPPPPSHHHHFQLASRHLSMHNTILCYVLYKTFV